MTEASPVIILAPSEVVPEHLGIKILGVDGHGGRGIGGASYGEVRLSERKRA